MGSATSQRDETTDDMDELEAALPRPRDDEPPDLRRQIVKELRDHLECAYNRELVLTGDAALAARRMR